VARGTQHLKKKPKAAAVAAPRQRSRSELRRQRRMEDAGMFFPGLRRHAKWMFVFLALVFAVGFVGFGVGSGSSGLGDVLQKWFSSNGGGPNISKLEATTKAHPKDAQAFRDLASAYEGKQKTSQAIVALERYSRLRPGDTDALQELAGLYQQRLSALSTQYSAIQVAPIASTTDFVPPSSTKLGQAYTDTNALADPIDRMVQDYATQQQSQIAQQASTIAAKIENAYARVVARDPTDATSQFQLAQAAQNAGDTATAISAYRKAKKLDPSTYGAAADQAVKQLQPTSSTTTTTPSAKSPKRK
jgi:tetratricopeptide (TPR) repeat protein